MYIHEENSFCKRHINCKFLLLEIHAKQLWHWYWNIAGINTIYLSIFTLIYSPSIQYNEIIEGLSLGRNIRFNPGLLMVSKRWGGEREKKRHKWLNALLRLLSPEKVRIQLLIFTYPYLRCTLLLESLDKRARWQIVRHSDLSVTIIRRRPRLNSFATKLFASWPCLLHAAPCLSSFHWIGTASKVAGWFCFFSCPGSSIPKRLKDRKT